MTPNDIPATPYREHTRKHPLPTIDALRQLFTYDPETGQIWHRNTQKRADTKGSHGYRTVQLPKTDDRPQKLSIAAHRLAFALMHNRWPHMIDHGDSNRSNNAWTNLSEVTARGNSLRSNQSRNAVNICRSYHAFNKQGFAWQITMGTTSGRKSTSRRDFCKAWQLRQKMRAERDRARKTEPKQ